MGLGKTPQASVVGESLRGDGRVLVVCPAGVRHQWVKWAKAVCGETVINLGPPKTKQFSLEWEAWALGQRGWGVVSYNKMGDALDLAKPKPRVMIFDEYHNYLQGRANTYVKKLWKVGALIPYKLFLSGSPYLAKPAGLWQPLNLGLGLRFGKGHEFDVRYCNGHEGPWGWVNNGATNIEELAQRLRHYMVRRTKQEVKEQLPAVTRVVRWVEGTTAARGAMASIDYSASGMRKALEPTLADKVKEVVTVADEADAPTVTFCWRRSDAEMVGMAMDKANLPAMVIHGENDASTRAAMVEKARSMQCHVVTTYGASATGLDGLQHFIAHAIFHAIDPVVATLLQAIARLDRIGQSLPVTATFIAMRDSVDEITVDKVVERLDVYQSVLGKCASSEELKSTLKSMNIADEKILDAIFAEMT
jgi:SWI/SNF-related matrix-associated actin-dependent regulator 1 of chromatin subfamily A